MKAGIAGAGAMGSIFAYYFTRSGIETTVYEKDREVCKALQSGLNIVTEETTEKINIAVDNTPGILAAL